MAKVYLAFLGTNDYLPCTYFFGDRQVANVRFVQEATVHLFCQGWQPEDRILILTTEDATRKNWVDHGHRDRDGQPLKREGLEKRLGMLSLQAQVMRVSIPEGKNEDEIWQIFDMLFGHFQEGDLVVFDITHAFRSIPMLAIVALNYAKVLKQVSLQGIYYGAFEVLGSVREVEKMPLDNRRVPLFDLAPFDTLLDWGTAVDRFLGAGDAGPVAGLAQGVVQPILRHTRGQDAAARAIRSLAQRLEDFTRAMATCRGPRIPEIVQLLSQNLETTLAQEIIKPLKPLLRQLADKLAEFKGDFTRDGLQAAQWCLDHNLIQQGFTILQEFLISYITRQNGLDYQNKKHRGITSQAVTITRKNLPRNEWHAPALDYPEITQAMINFYQAHPQLAQIYADLSQYRNDINHAAFIPNPRDARAFAPALQSLIDAMRQQLQEN